MPGMEETTATSPLHDKAVMKDKISVFPQNCPLHTIGKIFDSCGIAGLDNRNGNSGPPRVFDNFLHKRNEETMLR